MFFTNLSVALAIASGQPVQRENALTKFLKGVRDPANADLVAKARAAMAQRALTPGVSHVDAAIANMSVQYGNDEYIAERLMPVFPAEHKSGTYFTYDKRAQLAYPDDALGVRGSPNEVTRARGTDTFKTNGYGLSDYVDESEQANLDAPLDDLGDATAGLLEALLFKREQRIATIMTTSANFGSNTAALGSSARWDTTTGDPIGDILAAKNNLWMGRGASKVVAFMSLAVWTAMQKNAKMQETFKYTRDGLLQPQQWASYFGIDELLIGAARKDTANEGQTASYSRMWGDVFGLARVSLAPSKRNASFGATFRFGGIQTAQWFDPRLGTRGGWWCKAAVDEVHKIIAPDTGFLYTTVIG